MGAHVHAGARPWNSATTLYIGRTLQGIAAGRRLSVLDMGCGDGALIRQFLDLGHDFYGYDLPSREAALDAAMRPILGEAFDERIRIMRDERVIPFSDGQFDVVYANQVFEHVRFLDHMLGECVRVLKPTGTLIALFPLATYPIEGHSLVPFVHWLPPGPSRVRYLRLCLTLGIGRRIPGMGRRASAAEWDERLRDFTFYRFMNEIRGLLDHYFQESLVDGGGTSKPASTSCACGRRPSAVCWPAS
jgi:SAM-dependent methyltransferase